MECRNVLTYRCDGCGVEIPKGNLRYTLSIDIRAAYDKQEIGLTELMRDHRAELVSLIESMKEKSSEELEDSVHKAFKYDLCPACQRAYILNPLAFFAQKEPVPPHRSTPSFSVTSAKGKSSHEECWKISLMCLFV